MALVGGDVVPRGSFMIQAWDKECEAWSSV